MRPCWHGSASRPVPIRSPADLDSVDALVLPGGESTTMSMLLESSGLLDPLAQRLADGMPAMGTCAGMILLGHEILDGRPDQRCFDAVDIAVRRNAFGRQVDSFEADLAVDRGPRRRPCTPCSSVRRWSSGSARGSTCSLPSTVDPSCAARARCSWRRSIPSSATIPGCHELFLTEVVS